MSAILNFPNFKIKNNNGPLSRSFISRNIFNFHDAISFVHKLSYGRNSDRSNYSLIFEENKGTCSTKHATLAALALENNIFDIKFQTAVCKFDKFFDKKISEFLLDPLNVLYFPEMHCF